ncbi:MAG: ABC transporter ATP-binding protein, partial [Oscillospiraceae bacterium]
MRQRKVWVICMGATIRFENIYKSYGITKVINNVNLDIEDGDFVTILGPSGAGKTTLLKMLAGFEDPTSGSIYVNGEDISVKPIHKRNVGMLFQNYALFPHMTVNENVAFPLGIRKVPKAEKAERVQKMLEKVRLGEYGKRYPRELSGGQQQRVAMARALVFNPSVLLLDEPMAALDKQLRKQMQLEIKDIHNELGITTIS